MRLKGTEALVALLGKAGNRRLVEALVAAGVEFVVIGGTALAYHGLREAGQVDDLDLLLEPNMNNAERVATVLSAQLPSYSVSPASLTKPGVKIPLKDLHFYVELLIADKNLNAREIFDGSTLVSLAGTAVHVASIAHLRIMKEQAVKDCRDALTKHERDLGALKDA
jgi:hypothetical protein